MTVVKQLSDPNWPRLSSVKAGNWEESTLWHRKYRYSHWQFFMMNLHFCFPHLYTQYLYFLSHLLFCCPLRRIQDYCKQIRALIWTKKTIMIMVKNLRVPDFFQNNALTRVQSVSFNSSCHETLLIMMHLNISLNLLVYFKQLHHVIHWITVKI